MGEGEGEKREEGLTQNHSALSPFSLPSFPFSPETPDTQARYFAVTRHETITLS